MSELESVSASDFCLFREFHLPLHKQGLVWLGGVNMDTASATSNGSGKSTLSKAIGWGAFGDSIDGERGDGVIHKGAKKAVVELRWVDGWRAVRTRTKATPTIELFAPDGSAFSAEKAEVEAKIRELMGCDFATFRNTVLYGQRERKRFVDPETSDAERKAILHGIIRTALVNVAGEYVGEKNRELERIADGYAREVEKRRAALAELNLDSLKASSEDWERRRRARVEAEKTDARESAVLAKELLSEAVSIEGLERRLRWAEKKLEEARAAAKRCDELEDGLRRKRAEIRLLEQAKDRLQNAYGAKQAEIDLLGDEKCPTCTSDLSSGAGARHKAELVAELKKIEKRLENADSALDAAEGELEELTEESEKHFDVAREESKFVQEVADARAEIAEEARRKERALEHSKDARAALDRAKEYLAEANPYDDQIQKARARRKALKTEIASFEEKASENALERAHYKFWVRGFGRSGLPSHILDSVVPILTERANHWLEILSDGDITMWFRTQRELKSSKGEFRDEIDIGWEVEGVRGYPPSGGQYKKMEIATNLALMDLVATTEGGHMDMLFLDEVLDGLDPEGRQRVTHLLHALRTQRGTIFVVSHDSGMSEVFERSVRCVKKDGVSRLEFGE